MEWLRKLKDVEEQSLWDCLHDGEVFSVITDTPAETVSLSVTVSHLVGTDELPDDVHFVVTVHHVRAVMAVLHVPPYPFEEPVGVTREQLSALITAYHESYRAESIAWSQFEGALATDPLRIADASLFEREDMAVLTIGGHLDDDHFNDVYCEIIIGGRSLTARRSDDEPFDFAQLIDLGNRYWEAFAKRRADRENVPN